MLSLFPYESVFREGKAPVEYGIIGAVLKTPAGKTAVYVMHTCGLACM